MSRLFADPEPPALPPGIELLCADASAACHRANQLGGASLVVLDPPWGEYSQNPGNARPDKQYPVLSLPEIRQHVEAAAAASLPSARMALWWCWPLEEEARAVRPPPPWRYVSGGAWHKAGHVGVGYHWRGLTEPVALFARDSARPATVVGNGWSSEPGQHSAKPERWIEAWVRAWVPEGGLVLDPYAGLGGVARAVIRAGGGRRYVGAEIDSSRHAQALGLTATLRVAA